MIIRKSVKATMSLLPLFGLGIFLTLYSGDSHILSLLNILLMNTQVENKMSLFSDFQRIILGNFHSNNLLLYEQGGPEASQAEVRGTS